MMCNARLVAQGLGLFAFRSMELKNHAAAEKPVDGVKNWALLSVGLFWMYLIVDSISKYGFIKTPVQILILMAETLFNHRIFLLQIFICIVLQAIQALVIEKTLAKGWVSEKTGMTMHLLNVVFLPASYCVLAAQIDLNYAMCRLTSCHVVCQTIKAWSYPSVNSRHRKLNRQEGDKDSDKDSALRYPNNLTLRNTIAYYVFTPPIEYQMHYPQRGKPEWLQFFKLCLLLILVNFIATFIFLQLIYTETLYLMENPGDALLTIRFFVKLMIMVNIIWTNLAYINTYKAHWGAYAAITGFKEAEFNHDWWNADSLTTFWRKWNLPCHTALKRNVVLPLLQSGYSKTQAHWVAFVVAGLTHEYTNTLPMKEYTGISFVLTLFEQPMGTLTEHVSKKWGKNRGNVSMWVFLFVVHSAAALYWIRKLVALLHQMQG